MVMTNPRFSKFAAMSVEELEAEENELRTALFNLRLGNTTKELENTAQIRNTRRDLARVMTALTQKREANS
jgi:large subunit ribosomal protein L29